MAIDKSIVQEAIGNLRKELRGYKGKGPVVVTIEHGSEEEPGEEGPEEQEGEGEPAPDILDRAMNDLKKK